MIRPESEEKKKSWLDRLPKLGRASQLILLVGIFLILFIPMWMIYQQQPAKQAQLEQELSNLETILAAPTTKKDILEAEIKQAEAELEAAKAVFLDPNQGPEIIDRLLELAESNDIDVTKTEVSTSQEKITVGENKIEYPMLTFDIDLKGQVPRFQNFLLALDDNFPTCQVKEVKFSITEEEGEEDTASIKIDLFCYEGSE